MTMLFQFHSFILKHFFRFKCVSTIVNNFGRNCSQKILDAVILRFFTFPFAINAKIVKRVLFLLLFLILCTFKYLSFVLCLIPFHVSNFHFISFTLFHCDVISSLERVSEQNFLRDLWNFLEMFFFDFVTNFFRTFLMSRT